MKWHRLRVRYRRRSRPLLCAENRTVALCGLRDKIVCRGLKDSICLVTMLAGGKTGRRQKGFVLKRVCQTVRYVPGFLLGSQSHVR